MYVAQQLGRYHLLDRIAVGGMAEIYRAITFDSAGHEHMVAVKRVLSHLAEDDDFLQMLVDEAKIATRLAHPNVTKTYEFVRCGEDFFIAMEYVDGQDLRSILEKCRSEALSVPIADAVYVIIGLLEALHAAHGMTDATGRELSVVHRDVSPSNCIVSYRGHVKLCDFGIAKTALSRVKTRVGVIKGKVKYMSPEQAMGQPLDGRSDIFSCGSVLYEMLTKQPPFMAENEMALIFKVRAAKYTRPSKLNPKIPSALERILRTALAKSTAARYQTAREFADDLRRFLAQIAPTYSPSSMGRFLRKIFRDVIDADLKKLEQFIIGDVDSNALGQNLLAEVLGQGAQYTKFTPVSPPSGADRTKLLARVPNPETRLPEGVNLHDLKTEIIDRHERDNRVYTRKKRPKPGAKHHVNSKRETQVGTRTVEPDNAEEPTQFHSAPTQIFRGDLPSNAPLHQPNPPAVPPSNSADTNPDRLGPKVSTLSDPSKNTNSRKSLKPSKKPKARKSTMPPIPPAARSATFRAPDGKKQPGLRDSAAGAPDSKKNSAPGGLHSLETDPG